MEYITNETEHMSQKEISHTLKIKINELIKLCQKEEVPMFLTYYLPDQGYIYNGVFPEEIATDKVESEYWRFLEFLKIVVKYNKSDYRPTISKNKTKL